MQTEVTVAELESPFPCIQAVAVVVAVVAAAAGTLHCTRYHYRYQSLYLDYCHWSSLADYCPAAGPTRLKSPVSVTDAKDSRNAIHHHFQLSMMMCPD